MFGQKSKQKAHIHTYTNTDEFLSIVGNFIENRNIESNKVSETADGGKNALWKDITGIGGIVGAGNQSNLEKTSPHGQSSNNSNQSRTGSPPTPKNSRKRHHSAVTSAQSARKKLHANIVDFFLQFTKAG